MIFYECIHYDFYEMDILWVALWTLAHGTCLSAPGLFHLTQWSPIPSTCCKWQSFSLFMAKECSLVSMCHIVLIYASGHWNSFHFFPFVISVPTLSIPDLLSTIKTIFLKSDMNVCSLCKVDFIMTVLIKGLTQMIIAMNHYSPFFFSYCQLPFYSQITSFLVSCVYVCTCIRVIYISHIRENIWLPGSGLFYSMLTQSCLTPLSWILREK